MSPVDTGVIPSGYLDQVEPGVLIVVGFVLFIIPEPATSALGAGILLLGASWWMYQWGR